MPSSSKGLFVVFISLFTFTFISCSNTNKVISETAGSSTVLVEGKIIDEDSEEPVANVDIWVEGTTLHTNSDSDGAYSLAIPRGYYELHAGGNTYNKDSREISLENAGTLVQNFKLERKAGMGSFISKSKDNTEDIESEVGSEALSPKVQKFIDYYINDDLRCELVNPGEIKFTESDDDVVWINDPVTLNVINHELGYKVQVDLQEYASKRYSEIIGLNVDADYYFKEMVPKDEEEAKLWEQNRQKYFNGSLRHFLIAMASDKSPLYFGYRIYSGQFVSTSSAMAYSKSSVSDIEVEKYDVFLPTFGNDNITLNFDGELRVEYIRKGVEDPDGIMGLDLYKYQTSWLTMNSPTTEYSKSGTFQYPDNIQVKGAWRYTPVCKMLPDDYLPVIK